MRVLVFCGIGALLAGCSGSTPSNRSPPAPPPPVTVSTPAPASPPRAPVQIEMKNVHLHLDEGIVLDVRILRGEMVSRSAGPPVFDDQQSYLLRVSRAEISMDMPSLASLMNDHIFAYDGAPMKDVTVRATPDGRLEQKGKLHKGINVPVTMVAAVATTPDGNLQLHIESMKAAGVPTKGLMDLFGLKLESVVDLKARRGIAIEGNDIVIAPGQVLPPPEIQGRLSRVEVRGNRLFQTIEDGPKPATLTPPDPRAPNYVYFSGSDIRFGKLTMHGADLQLIDADPKDPFDFYPARYNAQLVAGYSKNTPSGGLKTYMPDFGDLRPPRR
jgi:hypothetical protein